MSDLQEKIIFRGIDGQECEQFIYAIRNRALAEGKQRNDEWMADVAAACLIDDALRWFETLDEEVQGSWKRLRPALLFQYPKLETRRGSVQSTSNGDLIPTPAAAPPLPAPIKNPPSEVCGRLKCAYVTQGGRSVKGWISQNPGRYDTCYVDESRNLALRVRYLRDLRRLETLNAMLPTCWLDHGISGPFDALKFVDIKDATKKGAIMWDVSPDNTVTSKAEKDGILQEVNLYITAGHIVFGQPSTKDCTAVQLTIEEV